MPEHTNYGGYTWNEILAAIYGDYDKDKNVALYKYEQSYPGGMIEIADRIQDVQNVVLNGYTYLGKQLAYLKDHWQGPASDAFQDVGAVYLEHIQATFNKVNNPNWRLALWQAGNYLRWAQYQLPELFNAGYKIVTRPPILSEGQQGPQQVKLWDGELAAQAGRGVLNGLVNLYFQLETGFGTLPVPPKLTELPSAAADKAEEKKTIEDEKKAIEEKEKKAEDEKKKFDEEVKKEKAEAKKAQEKAEAENKAALDKLNDDTQKALDKAANPPDPPEPPEPPPLPDPPPLPEPPPPPEPPGELGGPPPPAELGGDFGGAPGGLGAPPPPALGGVPVPGGTDLTGDGIADLDEKGKPLPGFGEQVPGGIDISDDGKPDFDEDGNPLPGGDFSSLPGGAPPALSGPFVPPPGTPGLPIAPGAPRAVADLPDEAVAGNRPARPAPVGGIPVVRAPGPDLDGPNALSPPKANTSIPFVRSPGSAGGDLDALGSAKLPKSNPFGAPVDDGSAGRAAGSPRPGIAGLGAGLGAGMGPGMGAGGYPPPMGGGMSPAGAGGQQNGERERQTWLLEDDEIWSEDGNVTSVLGRPENDDEDEEYVPQL